MVASIAASSEEGEKGRLYGFEIPPLAPGEYEIITEQVVSADRNEKQTLISTQPVSVEAVSAYAPIPANLVHSFYPPSLRLVSATTLPHVVLKGATAWERSSANYPPGDAPTPWLALLLFTEGELSAPAEVLGSGAKPSGTKALTLPLDVMNKIYSKFCWTTGLSIDTSQSSAGKGGLPPTADFIFVNSSAFRMYFERQDKKNETQNQADLDRYKFLTLMTDTGVDDGTGHANAKLSTLIGHRTRPYNLSEKDEKVFAHLVSIEDLANRIDWKAATASSGNSTIAMLSLYSWSFTWEKNNAGASLEMFKHLGRKESTRALTIPDPVVLKEDSNAATPWVKRRISEGYTIVRHRDIAGETSMALYRGPLTPRPVRRPHLRPSIHGTDLQIIDTTAQVLDVSYSTAWELGRSLAGRDAKFSAAIAGLRRQICMHAVTKAKKGGEGGEDGEGAPKQVMHTADDVMDNVLMRLDQLFAEPMTKRIQGLPLNGDKDKAARWQVPKHTATSTAASPIAMTQAKLRRYIGENAQDWIQSETRKLCAGPSAECEVSELPIVFNWIITNLMSLKLIPATYLFPDPSVLVNESINCFLIDDLWIDALVDGAMSLANTMGSADDPVRDQIRMAFNTYLDGAPQSVASIGGSGFVLKSGVVESFPDLEIQVSTANAGAQPAGTALACPYRTKNEDMILCLVGRGPDRKLADYVVRLKLPSHQQQFSMDSISKDAMTFTFSMAPYLTPSTGSQTSTAATNFAEAEELRRPVTWNKEGVITAPKGLSFPCPWSWSTGVLTPQLIADMTDSFIDKTPKKYPLNKVTKDSRSLYLATQLADRDHSISVRFDVTEGRGKLTTRQIYPEHEEPESDPRDKALVHVSPTSDDSGKPKPPSERSWLTKQAFSQDFPGESIPAESNTPQNLVFVIKTNDKDTLPPSTEVLGIDVFIPLGEDSSDLLDHLAPLPSVRTIGSRQQWISALTRRKTSVPDDVTGGDKVVEELVVHLKTRGGDGAVLMSGLDASFMLTKAIVNGVMGHDVEIKVKETYVYKMGEGGTGMGEQVQGQEVTVSDAWVLTKE